VVRGGETDGRGNGGRGEGGGRGGGGGGGGLELGGGREVSRGRVEVWEGRAIGGGGLALPRTGGWRAASSPGPRPEATGASEVVVQWQGLALSACTPGRVGGRGGEGKG